MRRTKCVVPERKRHAGRERTETIHLYLINPRNPLVGLTDLKRSRWNRYRVWRPLGLLTLAALTPAEWQITIFDETAEVRPIHELAVWLYAQQPWGRIGVGVTGFQYLHDLARHRITLDGEFNIRLFKGFSFRAFGSVSRVKDQIYLSGAGISEEDILVRRRQLGTNYTVFFFPSISYRFGSIFNNVVNPRFDRGGF